MKDSEKKHRNPDRPDAKQGHDRPGGGQKKPFPGEQPSGREPQREDDDTQYTPRRHDEPQYPIEPEQDPYTSKKPR